MKNPLKSRKFWMVVVSALLLVLNEGLGLKLPADTIGQIVKVVLGYVIVEGVIDAVSVVKNGAKVSAKPVEEGTVTLKIKAEK